MLLEGDHDVFGDGTVMLISTPGHTPGHQPLMVTLKKTGTVILTGDLYHYAAERTLKRLPNNDNKEQTAAAREGRCAPHEDARAAVDSTRHRVEREAQKGAAVLRVEIAFDRIRANDIRSLSDFKRNTSELLDRLKKTGNPLVLTINGKAEVVVQDAEAYQELLERVETIEGLQKRLSAVKAGRTKPAREVFNRLRRNMAYRVEVAKSSELGELRGEHRDR